MIQEQVEISRSAENQPIITAITIEREGNLSEVIYDNTFSRPQNGLKEIDQFLSGETSGYKVSVSRDVDVKAIRRQLNMTQSKFSDMFGFSLDAVKHWEGGRRTPEAAARAFLTVIAKHPQVVISTLHPSQKVRVAYKMAHAPKKKATIAKRAAKRATREHSLHV